MKLIAYPLFLSIALSGICLDASAQRKKEFLTEEEITLIQIKQQIDPRVKAYLEAAALRLKSAEARLLGEEPEQGDMLEYFTPEDMLDGYGRILESVMSNLEESYRKKNDGDGLRKALKELRTRTEGFARRLEFLEKLARERNRKEMLKLVQKAVEITGGAHDGADAALKEKSYAPAPKK